MFPWEIPFIMGRVKMLISLVVLIKNLPTAIIATNTAGVQIHRYASLKMDM